MTLWQIRLPLPGLVSILHRICGLALFLALPLALYLLQLSLGDEEGFLRARAILDSWPMQLLGILLLWMFSHHLFAGIRLLLIDIEWGSELKTARLSAALVLFGAVMVAVAGGVL